jgi:hypothetical protein
MTYPDHTAHTLLTPAYFHTDVRPSPLRAAWIDPDWQQTKAGKQQWADSALAQQTLADETALNFPSM